MRAQDIRQFTTDFPTPHGQAMENTGPVGSQGEGTKILERPPLATLLISSGKDGYAASRAELGQGKRTL